MLPDLPFTFASESYKIMTVSMRTSLWYVPTQHLWTARALWLYIKKITSFVYLLFLPIFFFLLVVRFISAFFGISHLHQKIGRWTIGLTEYPYPKSRTPIFKFQQDRRRVSVGFYFEQKFGIPVMRETKSVLMFKLYIQTEMSEFSWFMVKKLCIKALFELFSLELGGFWRNSSPAFLWK